MKPKLYALEYRGQVRSPITARMLADKLGLPLPVITKRLQRGERVVEDLARPVRCYAGNDGERAPTWHERRQAEREAARLARDEQRRIAAFEEAVTMIDHE